ncbi:MAG: hypothetical protein QM820_42465 [Minicystis sp.]
MPGAEAERFLLLVTLDSGARCGIDREGRWVLVPEDGRAPVRWSEGEAHLFHEALEWKRARFDDAVEEAARALGLPAEDVLFSFPAIEVIRAVLAKQQPYLTRLALQWIGPTELRALRREILAVTRQDNMPVPVKELAARLVVPE